MAGTGAGVFLLTMLYGVQRGLFSNEAGQGSAPIAHSAAKTDEPVSEGAVALLEPFIDTILICTMTGLVLITTGAFEATAPASFDLGASNVSIVEGDRERGFTTYLGDEAIVVQRGHPADLRRPARGALQRRHRHTVSLTRRRRGLSPAPSIAASRAALDVDGGVIETLYGNTVRTSAPLTTLAFERGLAPIGMSGLGGYIVLISVILFAISTSISWSYYGDRCANYLFGSKSDPAVQGGLRRDALHRRRPGRDDHMGPWRRGALARDNSKRDCALVVLSGTLKKLTDSYFDRKPWVENEEAHKKAKAEGRL